MQIFFKVFKFKGFNNFKKGPRVGGGLGGPRIEGYGWGYIGRGLKGGFKPKSGSKNLFGSIALKNKHCKSGQKVWKKFVKNVLFLKILTTICK